MGCPLRPRPSLCSGSRPQRPGCYGVRCRFRRDRAGRSLSLKKRSAVAATRSARALRIPHPKTLKIFIAFLEFIKNGI
ncbi:MAG: hypothetical protein RMJ53_03490, partial [Chitinophagales bacterium]|nr:hypothetical protein [Chitinophagales bacterium]